MANEEAREAAVSRQLGEDMGKYVTDAEVDAAYHAWRTAQRGSELQLGEYEATFSRVEFAWMRAALEAARRFRGEG